jgi:hypothetical protein
MKDRLLRKKYMGVWRWESILIKKMRDRFQVRLVIYISRNITKSTPMILGKSENPRSLNWVISVIFLPPVIVLVLLISERRQENALLVQVKLQHQFL